ncbi:MAG: hypothetical protein ACI814_002460, partial [Mariniblastus sp.]
DGDFWGSPTRKRVSLKDQPHPLTGLSIQHPSQ